MFKLNGRECQQRHYLTDGIYPDYQVFSKAFTKPGTDERKVFSRLQEAFREDIERAFWSFEEVLSYYRASCSVRKATTIAWYNKNRDHSP